MSRRPSGVRLDAREGGPHLEGLTADGERWVLEITAALRADDRAVAGGWPGTMSEAQTRLAILVSERRITLLSRDEHEQAARRLYESARRAWAARASAETDSDD
ncbi:MAG: hypothetical protein ACK6CU_06330 [Deltaproteobacteria bacterium]